MNKINSEPIYNKKYLKAEKCFQYLYIPVILFDSVHRKDGNYYPKMFLEKFIHNFFWRSITKFWFLGL